MPETSIVIKAEDRYSSTLKQMAQVTKAFDKDAEELERPAARQLAPCSLGLDWEQRQGRHLVED